MKINIKFDWNIALTALSASCAFIAMCTALSYVGCGNDVGSLIAGIVMGVFVCITAGLVGGMSGT